MSWDAARVELRKVVDAYEEGNSAIDELAAEAYSSLGLLEIETTAGRDDHLDAAVTHLQRAIAISDSDPLASRQHIWYGFLGYAHCQLGQTPQALDAYDHALRDAPSEDQAEYAEARDRVTLHDPSRC